MRKKELLLQNTKLFDEVTALELTVTELKGELSRKEQEIAELKKIIEELEADKNASEPLKELEEKVIAQVELEADVDYGATVIGKTVVEATKCCNSITLSATGDSAKELVNLILGRTEVAKAEILKVVSSDLDNEEKVKNIDAQYELAVDYFKSVMAQI